MRTQGETAVSGKSHDNDALARAIVKAFNASQPSLAHNESARQIAEALRAQPLPTLPIESEAYTVSEFCVAYRVSRSSLYTQWATNLGPRFFRVGKSIRISRASADEWRRARETATEQQISGTASAAAPDQRIGETEAASAA